jgi:hypothetical protein
MELEGLAIEQAGLCGCGYGALVRRPGGLGGESTGKRSQLADPQLYIVYAIGT